MTHGKALALSFLLMAIAISIHPVRADWVLVQQIYDGTFNVLPLTYSYIHGHWESNYRLTFDFECTAGGNRDIDFFICDSGNFNLWATGQTCYVYCRHDLAVSWNGEFNIPHSETWYVIFSNLFSAVSTKTIQLTLNLYQWQDLGPTTLGWMSLGIIGVIAIIVVVVVVVVVTRRKQVPSPPPPTSRTAPDQPPGTRRFCPQCGRPLEDAASFCSNCGYKL